MARPREHTDEEILDAASEVLLEHGVKVATGVIAARLGLSSAALFHRFGSKRNLIIQALMPKPPDLDWVKGGPDERPIAEQLTQIGQAIVSHMQTIAPRVQALRTAGVPMDELFRHVDTPPPVMMFQSMSAWFQRAIDQGRVEPGAPESYAMAFLGSLHGHHFFREVLGIPFEPSREEYIQSATRLFTLGCASARERLEGGQ